jgi:outer membrane receptor for ferric coprogen and ferric-rhodotorulic acid
MIKRFKGVLSFSLLCSFSATGLAQVITPPEPAPERTPAGQSTSSGQEMQQVVVTGANIPINEAIVPTVRPISGVYGLDLNVMEIPRNVTIISRAQLDDISVLDVRDFTKLTTSSFTTTNFGAPSNPSIRGQIADVFINGMREGLTSNGNGMPIDFNAFDSVDILKGPPGVVYGASNYVGGYFNFITEQPFFDRLQGSMSATFGSYDQYRWNIDLGVQSFRTNLRSASAIPASTQAATTKTRLRRHNRCSPR